MDLHFLTHQKTQRLKSIKTLSVIQDPTFHKVEVSINYQESSD